MLKESIHKILTYCIAAVWLINGIICKVLNLVPRHQEIVARILGDPYSGVFTKAIGVSEILMAVWIVSRIKARLNAVAQIIIVIAMNILEFIFAPDLLLWGRLNLLFAIMFALLIYYNEFVLNKKIALQKQNAFIS
ncbi:MAG TPA: DoxX-like family protein [Chitinophagaceae bacterium]|nr:DoxX-like family protein [Chitinophagaceae bacterium]